MAKINQVLTECQGIYEWRHKDCLTTAQAVIRVQRRRVPDYSEWHSLEESEAILRAQKIYGSLLEAHRQVFLESDLEIEQISKTDLLPGDICLLDGALTNHQLGITMYAKNITRLGFVADNFAIWTWFLPGLYPLNDYTLKGVIRCLR